MHRGGHDADVVRLQGGADRDVPGRCRCLPHARRARRRRVHATRGADRRRARVHGSRHASAAAVNLATEIVVKAVAAEIVPLVLARASGRLGGDEGATGHRQVHDAIRGPFRRHRNPVSPIRRRRHPLLEDDQSRRPAACRVVDHAKAILRTKYFLARGPHPAFARINDGVEQTLGHSTHA